MRVIFFFALVTCALAAGRGGRSGRSGGGRSGGGRSGKFGGRGKFGLSACAAEKELLCREPEVGEEQPDLKLLSEGGSGCCEVLIANIGAGTLSETCEAQVVDKQAKKQEMTARLVGLLGSTEGLAACDGVCLEAADPMACIKEQKEAGALSEACLALVKPEGKGRHGGRISDHRLMACAADKQVLCSADGAAEAELKTIREGCFDALVGSLDILEPACKEAVVQLQERKQEQLSKIQEALESTAVTDFCGDLCVGEEDPMACLRAHMEAQDLTDDCNAALRAAMGKGGRHAGGRTRFGGQATKFRGQASFGTRFAARGGRSRRG